MKIANILISDSWGDVTPEAINRGIGGREGALLFLSREWAKNGHEVTSFVNVEKGQRFLEKHPDFRPSNFLGGYHEYVPLQLTKPMLANFDWDVAIAWECPSAFDDPRIQERTALRIVEMQVAHLSGKETKAAEENCHYLAALSEWHEQFLLHSGVDMHGRTVIFPNGVDISRYPKETVEEKYDKEIGDNPKFIYSSSPDRGLWYLLQSWPYIREKFPKAELYICYGLNEWTNYLKWAHGRVGEMALEIQILINQPGVKNLEKIGQDRLAKLQLGADAWLYPLDSMQSTETGCISAIENAAAGNAIITTDCDCMEDEFGRFSTIYQLPFDEKKYAEVVIDTLEDNDLMSYQREAGRAFAEGREWSLIAQQWLQFFKDQSLASSWSPSLLATPTASK